MHTETESVLPLDDGDGLIGLVAPKEVETSAVVLGRPVVRDQVEDAGRREEAGEQNKHGSGGGRYVLSDSASEQAIIVAQQLVRALVDGCSHVDGVVQRDRAELLEHCGGSGVSVDGAAVGPSLIRPCTIPERNSLE